MLDGERGEPRVRNTGPADSRFEADLPENRPVPLAWLNGLTMWFAEQVVAKAEDLFDRAWLHERPPIGGYPDYRAQHHRRNAEPGIASHNPIQPGPTNFMIGRILSERMNEDVDVGRITAAARTRDRPGLARPPNR
jgi:hypothetical protein